MRANRCHAVWLVLALVGAMALSACYRPAGQDTEPTAVGQISVAATTTLALPVTEPPVMTEVVTEAVAEELIGSPTAEVITPPPSPLPTNTEAAGAALPDGQGGASALNAPTQTQVVAMVPTSSPSPTPLPPTQTPIIITATPLSSATPTLDPAFGIPVGASPVPFDRPFPTFTPSLVGGGQEAVPLGERPTETAGIVDGQGGQADLSGGTPIAQQPTLTTNQMTATSVVYQATARAAATLGTQLPPLAADGQGGQTDLQQPGVVGQQALPTATPIATTAPQNCGQHLITPGETLSYIAQQYGVTIQQMAQANNIVNADLIKAGDTLTVPCAQPATTTTTTDTSGQGGQTTTTTGGPTVYVVQGGDNIYRISLKFGITMSELLAANGMSAANMNLISVGQELVIPYTAAPVATAAPVLPTATPLPTLAPQGATAG